MQKRIAVLALSVMALIFAAVPARATTMTVTEFQALTGDPTAYPTDVTPDGDMVGVSSNSSGDSAVLWTDPASQPEELLGAPSIPAGSSYAAAINGIGTIAGNQSYYDTTSHYDPVVWTQNADGSYGEAEELPVPEDLKNGHTEEINDDDVIVGTAAIVGQIGQIVPVYWQRNETGWDFFELQRMAGSFQCYANDINNLGVITGTCGATAVRWNPSGGSYGAPVAMPGASASAVAINDGDVVVGAVGGNPAKWINNQNPTLPFGKKFGGTALDVNSQSWILARKSSGTVFHLYDGSTTTNLSTVLASQVAGFTSGGFGGNLTDNVGGVVLVSAGANVTRTGAHLMVPVLITMDLNN